MRFRGVFAGAVVLAATAIGGSGVAQAQGPTVTVGADGKTAPVFNYAEAIRERVWVPVAGLDTDSDGVTDRVAVDIVRPKESGPAVKVPAIIDPSPYYTSSGRGNETQRIITGASGTLERFPLFYDNYFVPRGYAFIAAHAVGTAFSTGCVAHGGSSDIAGFKAVIDWLNGRVEGFNAQTGGTTVTVNWHNGKSGMIGKSYDGTYANGTAATGVEGLTTVVPISAISTWYNYSRTGGIRNNTNYPSGLSSSIAGVQSDVGVQPPRPTNSAGQVVTRQALCAPTRTLQDQQDGDEHGDMNEFWRDRDHVKDASKVKASVFLVHGFQDDNVRMDQLGPWWDALKANNVKLKLWLLRAGHTDPFEQRRAEWVNTLHRWFDNQLQGIANGIDTEPKVTIEDAADTWKEYADWPIPGTQNTDVYLRGTTEGTAGTIGGVSGGSADSLTFTNTASYPSEGSVVNTPEGSQTNRRVFLSPPLTKPLRLSGTAKVNLRAAFGTTQSNVSAVIMDYGTGTQIARTGDGVQNTTTRTCWGAASIDANACPTLGQTCTVTAATGVDNACYLEVSKRIGTVDQWRVTRGTLDSSNRSSLWYQDASPVLAGAMNDYTVTMAPTEHIFEAGHRIGIVVVGNLFGGTAQSGVPTSASPAQPITLDTRASKVSLPIVGGTAAMTDAGAFTDPTAPVGGTVQATLALTLGTPASFGAFTPGITRTYTASMTANVISSAADAALTVSDPSSTATGHLVNGAFSLPQPLKAGGSNLPATVKTYSGPVSNDAAAVQFSQQINATDALRTGAYSKTLTFTLSTTQP
jgi:X-Pro dipeptidyl-peptidase